MRLAMWTAIPGKVTGAKLDLSSVETGPERDALFGSGVEHCRGAMHCVGWAVERGEDPVAGRFHDAASVRRHDALHGPVVVVQDPPPWTVPASGELFGGGDDVGEQHRGQHTIERNLGIRAGEEPFDLGEDRGPCHRGRGHSRRPVARRSGRWAFGSQPCGWSRCPIRGCPCGAAPTSVYGLSAGAAKGRRLSLFEVGCIECGCGSEPLACPHQRCTTGSCVTRGFSNRSRSGSRRFMANFLRCSADRFCSSGYDGRKLPRMRDRTRSG